MVNVESIKPRRRITFRFGLKTLFLVTTACCLWMAYQVNDARRQGAAVKRLRSLGHDVLYDYELAALPPEKLLYGGFLGLPNERKSLHPPGAAWLRRLLGPDCFQSATAVTVDELSIDESLPILKRLPHLNEVLMIAPTCGNSLPGFHSAKEKIKKELPNVKITTLGPPPVVG